MLFSISAFELDGWGAMSELMAFNNQAVQNGGVGVGAGAGGRVGGRKHIKHEDQEEGKLFVGGLSWETTQDSLLRYFSRFGEVIDCVVMKNAETGRSRGFGFVTFSDPNNIDSVIQSCPHSLDGRTIDPKPCNPRSMQKPKKNINWPKVFLGGLPSSITETDLRTYFSRYGRVTEVVIMYDQEKKKARGFGFLSFESDAAVDQAVAEHYVNIQNKQVEIKRAEPRNNPDNMGNGPVVDQWGAPPSNGISHAPATPTYSGWGAPPSGPGPSSAPAPQVTLNYSPQANQWGAPPHSQPSPVQHSWGAPPHAPQNSFAPGHGAGQPPPPQFNSNHFAPAPAPAPHIGTSYWGSPPGPTPPPSTPGELYAPGHHSAPPQSPSQHKFDLYSTHGAGAGPGPGHTYQLQPATPHTDYSRMYQQTKGHPAAPQAHYSSPTSPDYYSPGPPQCAPLPTYPPSNSALDQRVAANHHTNGPFAPQLSQVTVCDVDRLSLRYLACFNALNLDQND